MFDELNQYQNSDHFLFKKASNLSKLNKDGPGVFYILGLAQDKVDLVYPGKSGLIHQNGEFKGPLLNDHLSKTPEGFYLQKLFESKIEKEDIDALDINRFATYDDHHADLPTCVEAQLIQGYFEVTDEFQPGMRNIAGF